MTSGFLKRPLILIFMYIHTSFVNYVFYAFAIALLVSNFYCTAKIARFKKDIDNTYIQCILHSVLLPNLVQLCKY